MDIRCYSLHLLTLKIVASTFCSDDCFCYTGKTLLLQTVQYSISFIISPLFLDIPKNNISHRLGCSCEDKCLKDGNEKGYCKAFCSDHSKYFACLEKCQAQVGNNENCISDSVCTKKCFSMKKI